MRSCNTDSKKLCPHATRRLGRLRVAVPTSLYEDIAFAKGIIKESKAMFAIFVSAEYSLCMRLIHPLAFALASLFAASSLGAHCQIPCGIFSDELKFSELEEHVVTIEKSARLVRELLAKDALSANDHQQLIRWTINKESHAQKIIDETANYFLAQRIKTDNDHYAEKIVLLHHIILKAMKTKQSVETEATDKLSEKIAAFKGLYLDHSHPH